MSLSCLATFIGLASAGSKAAVIGCWGSLTTGFSITGLFSGRGAN
jgi:hypothetical protein